MPKETIHDTAGTYDVRVGWSDGCVQVGVEQAAGFSLVTQLYGAPEACERLGHTVATRLDHRIDADGDAEKSAALGQLGREVLNWVEANANDPDGSYTGVWSTLDRTSLNRLIRVLRNARDRAYGKDE